MRREFIMRGKTAPGRTEVLNFGSGVDKGYAYRLTEFRVYPVVSIPSQTSELTGSLTAGKIPVDPNSPNFSQDGLIGNAFWFHGAAQPNSQADGSIINDLFMITQDLHLMVNDSEGTSINWQCKFESVKMTGPEEAAVNYKQFAISDG